MQSPTAFSSFLRPRTRPGAAKGRSVLCFGVLAALTATMVACEGDDDSGDDGSEASITMALSDDNNYLSESALTLPVIETAVGQEIEICWEEVDQDIQCHDVDPVEDLDAIGLIRFQNVDQKTVQHELAAGELDQETVSGYLSYETDHEKTCADISEMSLFGTEVDIHEHYKEDSDTTYVMVATHGTEPGVGARVLAFLEPTSSSSNTRIDLPTGCGMLEFSADLASIEPVKAPMDGPWNVGWDDVTRDGLGNDIVPTRIDRVLIGFYDGLSVDDLQEQIMDLELIATDMWDLDLASGTTADLSLASHTVDGSPFSGFDSTDGTWIVGLMCTKCQNPAPVVLSILEPGA